MALFHGTTHPFLPGDALLPGIVQACALNPDDDPFPGCHCGCDGRYGIWATSSAADAWEAARRRACRCSDAGSADHRPRVFLVELEDAEPDPPAWGAGGVLALSGKVLSEVAEPELSSRGAAPG